MIEKLEQTELQSLVLWAAVHRVSIWRGPGTREKPNRPFPGRLNPGQTESSAYLEDTKRFEEPQSAQRQGARDVLLAFRKKKKFHAGPFALGF